MMDDGAEFGGVVMKVRSQTLALLCIHTIRLRYHVVRVLSISAIPEFIADKHV